MLKTALSLLLVVATMTAVSAETLPSRCNAEVKTWNYKGNGAGKNNSKQLSTFESNVPVEVVARDAIMTASNKSSSPSNSKRGGGGCLKVTKSGGIFFCSANSDSATSDLSSDAQCIAIRLSRIGEASSSGRWYRKSDKIRDPTISMAQRITLPKTCGTSLDNLFCGSADNGDAMTALKVEVNYGEIECSPVSPIPAQLGKTTPTVKVTTYVFEKNGTVQFAKGSSVKVTKGLFKFSTEISGYQNYIDITVNPKSLVAEERVAIQLNKTKPSKNNTKPAGPTRYRSAGPMMYLSVRALGQDSASMRTLSGGRKIYVGGVEANGDFAFKGYGASRFSTLSNASLSSYGNNMAIRWGVRAYNVQWDPTVNPDDANPDEGGSPSTFGGGVIAAIVIGCIAVLALVAFLAMRKKATSGSSGGYSEAGGSMQQGNQQQYQAGGV